MRESKQLRTSLTQNQILITIYKYLFITVLVVLTVTNTLNAQFPESGDDNRMAHRST